MKKFNDYLTIKKASKMMGVTENTLRNWEVAGKIQTLRHPINGYRLYDSNALKRILQEMHTRESEIMFLMELNKYSAMFDLPITWVNVKSEGDKPTLEFKLDKDVSHFVAVSLADNKDGSLGFCNETERHDVTQEVLQVMHDYTLAKRVDVPTKFEILKDAKPIQQYGPKFYPVAKTSVKIHDLTVADILVGYMGNELMSDGKYSAKYWQIHCAGERKINNYYIEEKIINAFRRAHPDLIED